ncbi:MAG TPA: GNAT family N-acetyltransferase [Anaerolineales bacterium]|jgi:ribosomal protein S18 acetylase RimI-like enzyme
MNEEFIPLSQLNAAALKELAGLHMQVMHSLLSELGAALVLRYYQCAQMEPSALGLCKLSNQGAVEGWAMGSPDPSALNARLRQPFPWFAGQMLRLACTHPGSLLHLSGSILGASAANQVTPGQVELTYIGVAPSAQGKGLGTSLLAAFCQEARQAGYRSVALSVETDNPAAIRLYTSFGFKTTSIFREGRFERQRMEYRLT